MPQKVKQSGELFPGTSIPGSALVMRAIARLSQLKIECLQLPPKQLGQTSVIFRFRRGVVKNA